MDLPSIELKNVKYLESLSEETHCFTATVYLNEKRFCLAENRGHGGETLLTPAKGVSRAEFDATLKNVAAALKEAHGDNEDLRWIDDLEAMVDNALDGWLELQEAKKLLRTLKVITSDCKPGQYLPIKGPTGKNTPENRDRAKKASWWKPEYVLLNDFPPEKVIDALMQRT